MRPDGTIVSGDEAVAGNEVLPVDRPTVPELPGGALETINEWAFEIFDEALLEEDDDIYPASHLRDRLTALETAT